MRLIDVEPFDSFIIKVPEDVFDACSYVRGVEDTLTMIRRSDTILRQGKTFSEVQGLIRKSAEDAWKATVAT